MQGSDNSKQVPVPVMLRIPPEIHAKIKECCGGYPVAAFIREEIIKPWAGNGFVTTNRTPSTPAAVPRQPTKAIPTSDGLTRQLRIWQKNINSQNAKSRLDMRTAMEASWEADPAYPWMAIYTNEPAKNRDIWRGGGWEQVGEFDEDEFDDKTTWLAGSDPRWVPGVPFPPSISPDAYDKEVAERAQAKQMAEMERRRELARGTA